jgi:hypothetical protein
MSRKILLLTSMLIALFFDACSTPIPKPIAITASDKEVHYLQDVKPIFDKRCVTCHSCYNSPCQAKLSSFEGVDRGASKLLVYDALRLKPAKPTRLFIDAQSTKEWRKKGFYSLTQTFDTNQSYNDSILMHMLYDKKKNPEIIGSYKPEEDTLICPRNLEEMGEYLEDKPNHGMPYGLPEITDSEYTTLTQWLAQGAKGPSKEEQKKLTTPSKQAEQEIQKWEKFLNTQDPKHSLTARYLYEHLFLAHIHFKSAPKEFFEIIRSTTPAPQKIKQIVTLRPYDDPKVEKFYYRLQKIHSTIVHKTHMVMEFDDAKLARIKTLFIESKWDETPHYVDYKVKSSANPFISFSQIPAKSKYQFLLNNAHYIVMTFIRGPVCRGQMALNVIHDHFWVMFTDPKYDLAVIDPQFLKNQQENLSMPIETSAHKILKTFSDDYRTKYLHYFSAKQKLFVKKFPQGVGVESIWKGERAEDAPLLTIYRHFDSASVHKGVVGELPRTMWVIDYSQLERIYYSLVAGYDVFGNISHQTNVRRYMDFLRLEGETNFIMHMPKEDRLPMLTSWYVADDFLENIVEKKENIQILNFGTPKPFKTIYPKTEFIENVVNNRILKSTNISFDNMNFYKEYERIPKMPKEFHTEADLIRGARSLTAPGTGFIKHVTDSSVNTALIRIILEDGSSLITTLVVNRWHDNVNAMFSEEDTLNPDKDTIDFVPYSIGSYPNAFMIVHYNDLPEFFDIIENFDGSAKYNAKLDKYFIGRSDEKFWETFDWFQNDFNKKNPVNAGLYDLNRYYPR